MNHCPHPYTCQQGRQCTCSQAGVYRASDFRLLVAIALVAWCFLLAGILGSCGLLDR